jgi:hypothetical protein
MTKGGEGRWNIGSGREDNFHLLINSFSVSPSSHFPVFLQLVEEKGLLTSNYSNVQNATVTRVCHKTNS